MKTRAAILVELNRPLVLDELEIPALAPGQVLVEILCSGICGSQLGEIRGVKGPDRYLPHLLGHEACGRVLDCGPGVTTVKTDDTVVLHWRPGTGIQAAPPAYHSPTLGRVNAGWIATFAERAVVSENRMTVVPANTAPELASLLGCAITTGFGVVNHDAKVRPGERLVVWGAGGIGLSAIQAARVSGAVPIVAVDLHEEKLALARLCGADILINATGQTPEETAAAIRATVGSDGAEVVIENTGDPSVIAQAYQLSTRKGRTILVGVPAAGRAATLFTLPLHFGKVLTGSEGGQTVPQDDIPRYLNLHRHHRVDFQAVVTDRFTLSDINTAIDRLMKGRVAGRAIIYPKELP